MSGVMERLAAPFSDDEIKFRVVATNHEKTKGMAAPYLDARTIQDRLDQVVGPERWSTDFQEWRSGVMCRLSIKVGDEWIAKCDGAECPEREPVKGGFSNSFRRAAVHWGIGRYLVQIPRAQLWVPIEKHGQSHRPVELPVLSGHKRSTPHTSHPSSRPTPHTSSSLPIDEALKADIIGKIRELKLSQGEVRKLLSDWSAEKLNDLTDQQGEELKKRLDNMIYDRALAEESKG